MEIIGIIFFILNILLWLFFYYKFKKIFSPNKILEKIRIEVDKLLVEINKETDRDLNLIEYKMKSLRELIDQVDKRIKLWEDEEEKNKKVNETLKQIDEIKPVKKDNSTTKAQIENAYKIKPQKKQESVISLFPAEDFVAVNQNIEHKLEKQKELSTKDKVLELFYQGIDSYLIAQHLDLSVAEVQTIINLFGH